MFPSGSFLFAVILTLSTCTVLTAAAPGIPKLQLIANGKLNFLQSDLLSKKLDTPNPGPWRSPREIAGGTKSNYIAPFTPNPNDIEDRKLKDIKAKDEKTVVESQGNFEKTSEFEQKSEQIESAASSVDSESIPTTAGTQVDVGPSTFTSSAVSEDGVPDSAQITVNAVSKVNEVSNSAETPNAVSERIGVSASPDTTLSAISKGDEVSVSAETTSSEVATPPTLNEYVTTTALSANLESSQAVEGDLTTAQIGSDDEEIQGEVLGKQKGTTACVENCIVKSHPDIKDTTEHGLEVHVSTSTMGATVTESQEVESRMGNQESESNSLLHGDSTASETSINEVNYNNVDEDRQPIIKTINVTITPTLCLEKSKSESHIFGPSVEEGSEINVVGGESLPLKVNGDKDLMAGAAEAKIRGSLPSSSKTEEVTDLDEVTNQSTKYLVPTNHSADKEGSTTFNINTNESTVKEQAHGRTDDLDVFIVDEKAIQNMLAGIKPCCNEIMYQIDEDTVKLTSSNVNVSDLKARAETIPSDVHVPGPKSPTEITAASTNVSDVNGPIELTPSHVDTSDLKVSPGITPFKMDLLGFNASTELTSSDVDSPDLKVAETPSDVDVPDLKSASLPKLCKNGASSLLTKILEVVHGKHVSGYQTMSPFKTCLIPPQDDLRSNKTVCGQCQVNILNGCIHGISCKPDPKIKV